MSNRPLNFNAERLLGTLQSWPAADEYLVAFSGGADSTALLHALNAVQAQLGAPISAVHVNHGIHEDSGYWQLQCEDFCRQYGIRLTCLGIKPDDRSGKGLEAEARHLRYEAMSTLLEPGSCLLTAHHADDQAETLLLNLMRGSGVDGMTAMPESRPLGKGVLCRPLLVYQSGALRDYLEDNGVAWIEDPSNQYLNHDRNFVRHEVIPLLETRWPGVSKRLLLTRKAMADARHLLEKLADDYLDLNLVDPRVLGVSAQVVEQAELLKLVIRRWLKRCGVSSLPVHRLESLCGQVRSADSDQQITICWDGWSLRMYRQSLWLLGDRELSPCPSLSLAPGNHEIDLGDGLGRIVLEGHGPSQSVPELAIGNRSNIGGAGLEQAGHHKSLKNLFQSAAIPPWLRDCIPLCKLNGELVAIGDWCFNDSFASWMSENRVRLNWRPQNPLLQFVRTQQHRETVDPASAVR